MFALLAILGNCVAILPTGVLRCEGIPKNVWSPVRLVACSISCLLLCIRRISTLAFASYERLNIKHPKQRTPPLPLDGRSPGVASGGYKLKRGLEGCSWSTAVGTSQWALPTYPQMPVHPAIQRYGQNANCEDSSADEPVLPQLQSIKQTFSYKRADFPKGTAAEMIWCARSALLLVSHCGFDAQLCGLQ